MNILIVDDEVIIRTGLASVISWSELGLNLLPPAASAEEALERLEEERPDILMTDIRMNGKSGLELAEEASRLLPGLEVIILSGYGDFDYTQQAIRQGVGDYLLKTSKPEEIIKTVLQAKRRLMERRLKESHAQRLAREDRVRQLQRWVIGGETEAAASILNEEVVQPSEGLWQVLLVAAEGWGTEGQAASLLSFAVHNMLVELLPHTEVFIYEGMNVCVRRASLEGRYEGTIERIEALLKCRLHAAKGTCVHDYKQVHQAYVTAQIAFTYYPLLPGGHLIDYNEVSGRQGGRTVLSQEEENGLGRILLEQDAMGLKSWTRTLAEALIVDPECTPLSFKACLQSAAVAAHRWLERTLRAIGREDGARYEPCLLEPMEGQKQRDILFRHLHGIMSLYHTKLAEGQTSHVQRAEAFIESCPPRELSLQQTATYVHLHPGHLSELFKKETGSTFGDYVTGTRMRRAMELLSVSPAKVSEVAAMTGYEDVKYFSRLFKKHTGRTPSEYRDHMLNTYV